MVTEFMEMGSLYFLIHLSGQKKRVNWRRRLKMLRDICRLVVVGLWCCKITWWFLTLFSDSLFFYILINAPVNFLFKASMICPGVSKHKII